MAKEWEMLIQKLPKYVNVLEIEDSEIHMLNEFNKKHKRNVVSNGYPTIAKVDKNKVSYYNGPRIMKNMMSWVLQKPTRKRKTKKNRTYKRKN